MSTVIVNLGNSDNKLTQREWSLFVARVRSRVVHAASVVHFDGGSTSDSEYQRHCFVLETVDLRREAVLGVLLAQEAREFKQDAIAVTVGTTTLVPAAKAREGTIVRYLNQQLDPWYKEGTHEPH